VNFFQYKDGVLCAEGVRLDTLAKEVGTPFYCYSSATFERHYKIFSQALPKGSLVAYSVKANGNLAVLKTLATAGRGRRRGIGRRAGQGAGRGHSRQQDRVFGRRQDAR
jgi:diaminopimelate decarboxylase